MPKGQTQATAIQLALMRGAGRAEWDEDPLRGQTLNSKPKPPAPRVLVPGKTNNRKARRNKTDGAF